LASVTVLPQTSYADPKPSIDEVQKKVDRLHEEGEKAAEQANSYRDKSNAISRELKKLDADIDRQQAEVEELRQRIGTFAAAEYKAAGMDNTMQLLLADDPEKFLAQMSSARALRGQQNDLLVRLKFEQKELADREALQRAKQALFDDARKQAKDRLQEANAKAAKAEALLAELTAEQREQLGGDSGSDEPIPVPPDSGRGGIALGFAQGQLGEPYGYGGAGPDIWDCSGLTMMAWAQAGVSLPHSSSEQYYMSAKVGREDLQPGDLVVFYSDLHHVGLYAGNGLVLHAPNSSEPVQYDDISSMPYAGAARPG
jgi:peptidoglycan DL-endopeptidase CwlO